jgi:hypothetical protein
MPVIEDFKKYGYNPICETFTQYARSSTQENRPKFIRSLVTAGICKICSNMGTKVITRAGSKIIPNMYMLALMPSGFGKTRSVQLIEKTLITPSFEKYTREVYPKIKIKARERLLKLLVTSTAEDPEMTSEKLSELATAGMGYLGDLYPKVEAITPVAVLQAAHQIRLHKTGSLNLEIDEIGSYLSEAKEVLNMYLKLYDTGELGVKAIKVSKEALRVPNVKGHAAANLLLFGTPAKVFDGANVESLFTELLSIGFGRRLLYVFDSSPGEINNMTSEEIYDLMANASETEDEILELTKSVADNVTLENVGKHITMPKSVYIKMIEYQKECIEISNNLPDIHSIRKAEILDRSFKALKYSAAYCWVSGESEISIENLAHAVNLIEDSGEALIKVLTRTPKHIQLFQYLCQSERAKTEADIVKELTSFCGTKTQREDIVHLAFSHAQTVNGGIVEYVENKVKFYKGYLLEESSIDSILVSYSKGRTFNYIKAPELDLEQLKKVVLMPNYCFTVHNFVDGHRNADNVIYGFNLIVLDADSGEVSLQEASNLLQDYTHMIYATKRHTVEKPRFRVILPMSHKLKLDKTEFTKFMRNVFLWAPLNLDEGASDIARAWSCNKTEEVIVNSSEETKLVNAMQFTAGRVEEKKLRALSEGTEGFSKSYVWFRNQIETGENTRNVMLFRFLKGLQDSAKSISTELTAQDILQIKDRVTQLNESLTHPLTLAELNDTIFKQL